MKKKYLFYIRAIAWLALWILPIPFGMLASDRSFFAPLSVLVFLIASISLPVTVRYRQIKQCNASDYAPTVSIVYGGLVGIFIAIGILNGFMVWNIWSNYYARIALFFGWMLGTVSVQTLLAWGFAWWKEHRRKYWYSEFLDPILYSLPLPCAIMGMLTYPAVFQSEVSMSLAIGLMAVVGFGFLATSICTIAVFAFYFYPSKKQGFDGTERWVQLLRVLVMVFIWLLIHNQFFDTAIGAFVVHMMPLSSNNIAVFITPFIFESLMIIICVAVGNIAVMGLHKIMKRNV
jgi:hypothetical protein